MIRIPKVDEPKKDEVWLDINQRTVLVRVSNLCTNKIKSKVHAFPILIESKVNGYLAELVRWL